MRCEITVEPDFLKAELFDRQTPEETRDALAAIAAAARKHACSQISYRFVLHGRYPKSINPDSLNVLESFNGTPNTESR